MFPCRGRRHEFAPLRLGGKSSDRLPPFLVPRESLRALRAGWQCQNVRKAVSPGIRGYSCAKEILGRATRAYIGLAENVVNPRESADSKLPENSADRSQA